MAITKPETKKQERSLIKLLFIAAAVIIVIGLWVLISDKAQRSDPTMTAAPPSGNPAQPLTHASPDKMVRQQQIQAKMNAEAGFGGPAPH